MLIDKPGAVLTWVRVPGTARNFSPRVIFQCRLSYGARTAHERVRVDDLPPHSTYYNCVYEQENEQTNDDVLDSVLTMTVWLNYELKMLRNLKALYKYADKFLTIGAMA